MYPQGSKKSSSLNTKHNETADMETQITADEVEQFVTNDEGIDFEDM